MEAGAEAYYTTLTRFRKNFGLRRMRDVKLRVGPRELLNAPGSWRLYSRNKTRCWRASRRSSRRVVPRHGVVTPPRASLRRALAVKEESEELGEKESELAVAAKD